MEKIKVSMISGASIEKPLVTAFRGNGGEYVVLDNEMNGTMGLPIILVAKIVNKGLSLIPDSEWMTVKESLRLIIAGNQVDYIAVSPMLEAQDNCFKQLTLPVASFEALQRNYKVVEVGQNPSPVNVSATAPSVEAFNSVPNQNVQEVINPVVENVAPVSPVNPVMPNTFGQNQNVSMVQNPVNEPVMPMPNVEQVPEVKETVPVDFTADKEAFLKACENMFDALVAKFNNK